MAFSRGSFQKRKNPTKTNETNSSRFCLLNENVFPGLIFKKDINNTQSTLTVLKNRPNIVLSEKNIIILDYSENTNEDDLNQLHATFSTLVPQQSTFTISNARYVQDEFSIDVTIDGTYEFLNFMNGNLIVAKSSSNIGNFDKMKWTGKFFIKNPQIEITNKFHSSKKIDKLVNLIHKPNFNDWGIMAGDKLNFIGTQYNDENDAMVIAINDDMSEITLSEIIRNESAIGLPIKIQHTRQCSTIESDVIYETQKTIEVQSNKKEKTCRDGYHWMPPDKNNGNVGFCMEGRLHGIDGTSSPVTSAPRTSSPVTSAPRTSSPVTSTPRTSTPRTSTPRTSTPRTGGGGSGY